MNGDRDDDQHPVDYERRSTKSKQPAKPKVKVGIREYRKDHWQLTFSYEGKQVHLQKWIDGTPLTAKPMAVALKGIIEKDGYDAVKFGKDKTFNFDVATRTWVKLSQVSPEWKKERSRIVEKIFIPHFGKTDIRKITTIRVDEFQVALQNRKLSPKYISGIMGELKAFFRFNRKALPDLPDFRKIQLQEKPIRWLTWEEQDTVFTYIPDHHKPIFQFLRAYGCRLNESCGLTWNDIHNEHRPPYLTIQFAMSRDGTLKQSTKTKRIRVLPIVPSTEHLFREPGDGLVFEFNGKPYTSKKLGRIWDRAAKKAGIKMNVYNGMRHSWAMQRLNTGHPLSKVQSVLGHTTSKMTERYAQYTAEALTDIIEGINKSNLFIPKKEIKLLESKEKVVGGTGIEPVTSGL